MDKHLHIVTHEIPWPAGYGGVMDLFYKIRSLHKAGIKIHLHCFTKRKLRQPELEKYCVEINYYFRKKNFLQLLVPVPFIVQSRRSFLLKQRLQEDDYPILLEGIHCSHLLVKGIPGKRKIFLRLHNVEYKYYRQLARHELNIFKRLYFNRESRLLFKYEKYIANKAILLAVSKQDEKVYKEGFNALHIHFLPVFLAYNQVTSQPGRGSFCLYHGNLAVNENDLAARWLMTEIFNEPGNQLVIAGKNPTRSLQSLVRKYKHISLVINPSDKELQQLMAAAHVHVLPSFNITGVKLKLLNALFSGRFCVVNPAAVAGSGIEQACETAEDPGDFKKKLKYLFTQDFTETMIQERKALLENMYNNEQNCARLIEWIY